VFVFFSVTIIIITIFDLHHPISSFDLFFVVDNMTTQDVLRRQILNLYRAHLRASQHFAAYNFRQYFIRWTRDQFRKFKQNQMSTDVSVREDPNAFIERMKKELIARQRQCMINRMFQVERLVVENINNK
jgi:hypothetical protein